MQATIQGCHLRAVLARQEGRFERQTPGAFGPACQGERTVEALAAEAELSIASTSQDLQILRGARLVEASKEGLYVTYRIGDPAVGEFVLSIRVLAEQQLAEVEQISRRFFEGRRDLEPIDRDGLVKASRRITTASTFQNSCP